MNWFWTVLVLVLLGTALGVGRGFFVAGKSPVSLSRLLKGGREGVRLLLSRVESEQAPDFIMGAMCYRTAAPPERTEYICPVCGERTWFGGDVGMMLGRDAGPMRRAIAELEGNPYFQASLDESAFCSRCSGGLNPGHPGFILELVYAEGDTVSTPVQLFDLQMLVGFVSGELVFADSYDARLPLRESLPRLRTLLGVDRPQGGH